MKYIAIDYLTLNSYIVFYNINFFRVKSNSKIIKTYYWLIMNTRKIIKISQVTFSVRQAT